MSKVSIGYRAAGTYDYRTGYADFRVLPPPDPPGFYPLLSPMSASEYNMWRGIHREDRNLVAAYRLAAAVRDQKGGIP